MEEDFSLQDPIYGDGFSYSKAYETIIKRDKEIKFAKISLIIKWKILFQYLFLLRGVQNL